MEKINIKDINLRELLKELLKEGFTLDSIEDKIICLSRNNKHLYIGTYNFSIYSKNNNISLDYKTLDTLKIVNNILELIVISNNLDLL